MVKISIEAALEYHENGRPGKIEVKPTKPYRTQTDLSLAYSPGVAYPCLEIQQNSDLTYRIYDWDRVGKDGKPRELHIDKAVDVIDFNSKAEKIESNGQNVQEIMKTKYFNVDKIKIEDIYTDISNIDTFYAISITDGSGKIYYENKEFNIKKGDSFIVPAKLGEYKIEGKIELLKSYIS